MPSDQLPPITTIPDHDESDPWLGKTIGEKYLMLSLLGKGGMGAVYRARRMHIGDEVAVKILHREFVNDEKTVERFRREAQAAAMLRHPTIVAIYDFSEGRGAEPAYIVMELVEGKTMRTLLETEGAVDQHRSVALIREVCKGVGVAHRANVVHRDIKPDNIMILPADSDDGAERVKVVDFGIAKLRDLVAVKTLTQTGRAIGTVYYMSPEQCCAEHLDARSDVYSLGAVLYELLAGAPPFRAETGTAIVAKHLTEEPPPFPRERNIAPAVEAVVMCALAKDAMARPEDAIALRDELGRALNSPASVTVDVQLKSATESTTQIADTVTADTLAARPTKSRGLLSDGRWLVVGLLLLFSAVGYGVWWKSKKMREARPPPAKSPSSEAQSWWPIKQSFSTDSRVYALAFSPGDRLLATASSEGLREDREFISEIRIWDANTGQLQRTITEHSEGTLAIAFSPDGNGLASVTGSGNPRNKIGKVKLWDPRTGALKWAVSGHNDYATAVAFTADGNTIASGSRDHSVKLWDTETGILRKTLTLPDEVNAIAISRNNVLAVAGKPTVELWDLDKGEQKQVLSGNQFSATSIAFSPDGQIVAAGDLSGKVVLWDVRDGRLRQTVDGHSDLVVTLAFSPDGKLLASGSYDGRVVIWNIDSGAREATLVEKDKITAVAFSHSGNTFASGGWSKVVKVWGQ